MTWGRAAGRAGLLRARFGHVLAAALCLVAAACPRAAGAAAGPTPLTVHVSEVGTVTRLHLQPGFATVLRADRPVDTVAIGDPRLVTATTVKRGQGVYDLIIQPQVQTGTTNMIVWLGNVTTVWELDIGPALRTADVVYVVTRGTTAGIAAPGLAAASAPAPPASGPAPAAAAVGSAGSAAPRTPPADPRQPRGEPDTTAGTIETSTIVSPRAGSGAVASTTPASGAPPASAAQTPQRTTATQNTGGTASPAPPAQAPQQPRTQTDASAPAVPRLPAAPAGSRPAPPAAAGPTLSARQAAASALLEVRQTVGQVTGIFRAVRTAGGVAIRYRITNRGGADLAIRPSGVLMRINGRLVPYAMARQSADPDRPELLPRGATETGVIEAAGDSPRHVGVILSLFPPTPDDAPAWVAPPLTFEPSFAGLDRLPVSAAP